jgi:hypothetical protein
MPNVRQRYGLDVDARGRRHVRLDRREGDLAASGRVGDQRVLHLDRLELDRLEVDADVVEPDDVERHVRIRGIRDIEGAAQGSLAAFATAGHTAPSDQANAERPKYMIAVKARHSAFRAALYDAHQVEPVSDAV